MISCKCRSNSLLMTSSYGRIPQKYTLWHSVSHVKVMGDPLCPAFDIEILEPSGKFVLKYNPEVFEWILQSFSEDSNMSRVSLEEEVVEYVTVAEAEFSSRISK